MSSAFCPDYDEIQGVNNQAQLARARRILNERLLAYWMAAGVTIVDPSSTWIDVDVRLEPGARISQSTQLEGRTIVGAGASVGPGCLLRDTAVGAGGDGGPGRLRGVRDRARPRDWTVRSPDCRQARGAPRRKTKTRARNVVRRMIVIAPELKHVAIQGELTQSDRHYRHPRAETDAFLLRPGVPGARPGDTPALPRHRADANHCLRLRERRDLRAVPGVRARQRRVRPPEPHGADQPVRDHGTA